MATHYLQLTDSTHDAAASRLAMHMAWDEITEADSPKIVPIKKRGQPTRYAIQIQKP